MLSKRFPILTIFIDHANVVIEIIAVKTVKYISFIARPGKNSEIQNWHYSKLRSQGNFTLKEYLIYIAELCQYLKLQISESRDNSIKLLHELRVHTFGTYRNSIHGISRVSMDQKRSTAMMNQKRGLRWVQGFWEIFWTFSLDCSEATEEGLWTRWPVT